MDKNKITNSSKQMLGETSTPLAMIKDSSFEVPRHLHHSNSQPSNKRVSINIIPKPNHLVLVHNNTPRSHRLLARHEPSKISETNPPTKRYEVEDSLPDL